MRKNTKMFLVGLVVVALLVLLANSRVFEGFTAMATGAAATAAKKAVGEACTSGVDCQSSMCSNSKCA